MSNYITKEVTIEIENDSVIWELVRKYYATYDKEEKERFLTNLTDLIWKRIEDKIYG